jgi:hypothetical protein
MLADIAVASPFQRRPCRLHPRMQQPILLTAYLSAIHACPSFADWIRREKKMLRSDILHHWERKERSD